MGYTQCVYTCAMIRYRCIWATHNVYMCYDIGVYGLHTMFIYTCYVIGVYGYTLCTCAML